MVLFLTGLLLTLTGPRDELSGQAEQIGVGAEAQKRPSLVKLIVIDGPVDERVDRTVNNTAAALQAEAVRLDEEAVLVLEIHRASSKFGLVLDLAKSLTSANFSRVRTIAWIPEAETVDGHNAILALACREIVMHPDAELGDIGVGEKSGSLAKDEQFSIVSLVERKHNPKLSRALVLGMTDRSEVVLRAEIRKGEPGNETTEHVVVTPDELERLRGQEANIPRVVRLKEAGDPGLFSGRKARDNDILIVRTAESLSQLARSYNLPPETMRVDPTLGEDPRVALIKIDGPITYSLEAYVSRQIARSVNDGVNILIFEIDSPGGYLLASENLANIIAEIDPQEDKILTVAYIPREAISGAAIIALGCERIYLGPDAQFGDAGPIELAEGGQFEHAPEKIVAKLSVTLGSLAERKNRPSALAMAMADKDLKVYRVTHPETGAQWYMSQAQIDNAPVAWQKGPVVPETNRGVFFTVTGDRAHELMLAEPAVSNWEDLKTELRIPPDMQLNAMQPTWVDSLVFLLRTPFVTGLLFVVGGACIYIELHFMTGFFGILSALCFSLFFWSRYLDGSAGWLEVILFLLGVICVVLEIFVIPGFGVFGVSGGLLLLAALIMAGHTFRDFNTLDPNSDMTAVSRMMGTLTVSIITVGVLAMVLSRYLPHMPVFNRMALTPPGHGDDLDESAPKLRPDLADAASAATARVGQRGVALSVLRPAGKARVENRLLDVISDGPYIDSGSTVEIIEVSGNRIVVREV